MSAHDGRLDLYLVRHAFASHADPARWPDDADRPLTEDGVAAFRKVARGLRLIVPSVDLMLSSAFARAWQTAQLLHDVAGWPPPQECTVLEAGRPASAALDVLQDCKVRSLALVGHEPHLSTLASLLCTRSEECGADRAEERRRCVALVRRSGRAGAGVFAVDRSAQDPAQARPLISADSTALRDVARRRAALWASLAAARAVAARSALRRRRRGRVRCRRASTVAVGWRRPASPRAHCGF